MRRTIRRTVLTILLGLLVPAVVSAQQAGDVPTDPSVYFSPEFRLGSVLAQLIFGVIVAALLIHLAPGFTRSTVRYVREDTAETGIVGFATIVGTFIVAVILFVTLIGAVLGIPLLLALILLFIPASAVINIALGLVLYRIASSDRRTELTAKNLWIGYLVGFVALALLGQIPVLNILVSLAAISLGLGAVIQHFRNGAREGASGGDEWGDGPRGGEPEVDDGWGTTDDRDRRDDGFGQARDDRSDFGQSRDERGGFGAADDDSRRDDSSPSWNDDEDDSSRRDDTEEYW
ncbi:hypothetical protein ACFQDG_09685 [Natronoarchaeum mannanilyticum]|uniref:DUF8173 domain-containing protein n=1 Tax=Natronoarchaeum mannanilyticum TaxID=926360 RepID=A0AAV3T752_9EURY